MRYKIAVQNANNEIKKQTTKNNNNRRIFCYIPAIQKTTYCSLSCILVIFSAISLSHTPVTAQQQQHHSIGCQNKLRQLQNKQLSFLKNITTLAKALDTSNRAAKSCISQLKICNQYTREWQNITK